MTDTTIELKNKRVVKKLTLEEAALLIQLRPGCVCTCASYLGTVAKLEEFIMKYRDPWTEWPSEVCRGLHYFLIEDK